MTIFKSMHVPTTSSAQITLNILAKIPKEKKLLIFMLYSLKIVPFILTSMCFEGQCKVVSVSYDLLEYNLPSAHSSLLEGQA